MLFTPTHFRFSKTKRNLLLAATRKGLRLVVSLSAVLLLQWPASVSAEWITRSVTIGWDASPSSDIAGYRVHYGTGSGRYPSVIDVGQSTSCQVPNLIEGRTYFFAVTAYTAAGEESALSEEFVHTPNPALFLNISARARVQSGDDVMIAGFIIGGSSWKTVVIRGLGPSLDPSVPNRLPDPVIELYGPGGSIAQNNNWRDGSGARLEEVGIAPSHAEDAALVVNLAPGAYSVVLRGKNGVGGTALLEIYDGGIPATQ